MESTQKDEAKAAADIDLAAVFLAMAGQPAKEDWRDPYSGVPVLHGELAPSEWDALWTIVRGEKLFADCRWSGDGSGPPAKAYHANLAIPAAILADVMARGVAPLRDHIAKQIAIDLMKAAWQGDASASIETNMGKLLAVQDGFLRRLRHAGVRSVVWRGEYQAGRIVSEARGLAGASAVIHVCREAIWTDIADRSMARRAIDLPNGIVAVAAPPDAFVVSVAPRISFEVRPRAEGGVVLDFVVHVGFGLSPHAATSSVIFESA